MQSPNEEEEIWNKVDILARLHVRKNEDVFKAAIGMHGYPNNKTYANWK